MIDLKELKEGDVIQQIGLHNDCMPGGPVCYSMEHKEYYVPCAEGKHFLHAGNLSEFEKMEKPQ